MPNGIRTLSDIVDTLDSIINELEARQPCPDSHGYSGDYTFGLSRLRESRLWLESAVGKQPATLYDASDREAVSHV